MSENKIILTQTQAEAFCDHYCRYPFEWDEEKEGCALAESDICKCCPLEKAIKAAAEKKKPITSAEKLGQLETVRQTKIPVFAPHCLKCKHFIDDDPNCIMCNAANGWKYYEGE